MTKSLKKYRAQLLINRLIFFILLIATLSSCIVTNNLYVNDPVPLEESEGNGFVGIGMGFEARVDSVSYEGRVFSSELNRSFNLSVGGMYGVTDRVSLGGRIHLPNLLGGFGANIRPQISLFHKDAIFNLALSGDLGFVIPKDSIKIFGTTMELENEVHGAVNADIAIPMCLKFSKDIRLIVTPRLSYNTLFLRRSYESYRNNKLHAKLPCLSLGLSIKSVYLESSVLYWNNKPRYMFGVAFLFEN